MRTSLVDLLTLGACGCFAAGLIGCAGSAAPSANTTGGMAVVQSRHDDDDDETETLISLNDLPAAVRAALGNVTPESAVTQVTRDEEAGQTSYDVEYTKDGAAWAVEFSTDGSVLENELEGDDDGEDQDD